MAHLAVQQSPQAVEAIGANNLTNQRFHLVAGVFVLAILADCGQLLGGDPFLEVKKAT